MSWLSDAWQWYAGPQSSADQPHAVLVNPIIAGVGATILLWAAIRQARSATRQAQIASLRHEEQTKAEKQRRITESFSKAIEQLGDDKVEVRLGGIYTLERISRESSDDYRMVMETLFAFVRERAPSNKSEPTAAAARNHAQPPTDIAAVLAVIIRRDEKSRLREAERKWRLDFTRTNLGGANLFKANLGRANFSEANLSDADLSGAFLGETNFNEANLTRIKFNEANLRKAVLIHANLSEAFLIRADLREAIFGGANLSGANLREANLSEANLGGANFSEANLRDADLRGAYFGGANLHKANLRGALLAKASLGGTDLSDAIGDGGTQLPAGIARPAHWPAADLKAV